MPAPARKTTKAPAAGGFAGIPKDAFAYLKELAACQDKAWYEASKPRMEASLRAPIAALVEALSETLAARGVPLTGDAKRSTFRMHRDVRFSKDKSPYKAHAGAVLYRPGGGKSSPGILYVHVAPSGCFAAAAFFQPEPDVLAALRSGIRARPEAFMAAVDALAAAGLAVEGESLTRLPRGFDDMAGTPAEPFVKLKSLIARTTLTQAQMGSAGAGGRVAVDQTATDEARGMDQAGRLAKFLPNAR